MGECILTKKNRDCPGWLPWWRWRDIDPTKPRNPLPLREENPLFSLVLCDHRGAGTGCAVVIGACVVVGESVDLVLVVGIGIASVVTGSLSNKLEGYSEESSMWFNVSLSKNAAAISLDCNKEIYWILETILRHIWLNMVLKRYATAKQQLI